jgi:hypothetical protein
MTENTTTTDGTEAEEAELVESKSTSTALPDELVEIDEPEAATEFVALGGPQGALPEELIEIDEEEDEEDVPGTGVVSGGFGFAGLVLGLVSLTTNWTSSVQTTRSLDNFEVNLKTSMTNQQYVDMAHSGWHTQAWWALIFGVAALLFGAGSLLSPSVLLSGKSPAWAKAASVAALIVGLVGVVLAVLTLTDVIGAAITAPTTTAS